MLRALTYTILLLFILAVVRMLLSTIRQGVGELFQSEFKPAAGGATTAAPRKDAAPSGGPLKRDPVCGTYVPSDASVHRVVNGETLYFCSPECRDKYFA